MIVLLLAVSDGIVQVLLAFFAWVVGASVKLASVSDKSRGSLRDLFVMKSVLAALTMLR